MGRGQQIVRFEDENDKVVRNIAGHEIFIWKTSDGAQPKMRGKEWAMLNQDEEEMYADLFY